nr:retrovirus-related Pol polyprotein from transposon TNT 1-94 [Tanacetum cinerariifolium]
MFRINSFKTSREEKHVPNNVRASARTKPITVSQPPVITKKDVNSDSNGLSSTGIDNTKTRRPQPRSNTKNDRVPSVSKSSRSKNKRVKVEEHYRNLLLFKNTKHMSSACNNIKLDSQNVISKVVCAMCKQYLIYVHHDVCLRNYVNGKTSHVKKQKANVSIKEKQKKHQPKVKKTKKVIQIFLWCVDSGCSKHMTRNLKLLINFVWKFMGTVRFENDHVAAILDFGDLQWGNILITRVYFVEGLDHNLFSVGQFCDSDLEYKWKAVCFGDCGRLLSLHVEAARTMLISSRASLFLWAEAIATACFTQNRSIIHRRFNKTPYELINGSKPDISFLHVFGALCYPKNDREDIGKLDAKGDIGFFIGYSADSCSYRIYNRRTKKIIETMNVLFDELSTMAFEQCSSKPGLHSMTSRQISSGLDLTYAPSTITSQQPTEGELDLLFEAMYDDFIGG